MRLKNFVQLILVKEKKIINHIFYNSTRQRNLFQNLFLVRVKVPFSSKAIGRKRPLFFSSPYNGNYFPSTSDQYNSRLKMTNTMWPPNLTSCLHHTTS